MEDQWPREKHGIFGKKMQKVLDAVAVAKKKWKKHRERERKQIGEKGEKTKRKRKKLRKRERERERERHLLEEWAGLVRSEEDGENSWNHDVDGARRPIQSAKEKENTRELEGGGRACPELPRGVYRPFDLCRSSLLPRSIDTSYFYGWSQP